MVKFESTGAAATCIDVMNGRFFAGRKLECSFWDGADYTYRESKDEAKERADKFSEWLEQGSSSSEAEEESDEGEKQDEGEESEDGNDAVPSAATIHAGRVLPDSDDDEEDEDEDEEDEEDVPASDSVHAGRVMPDLDDDDDED